MPEIEPPVVDSLFDESEELPTCKSARPYEDRVVEFMELFGLSKAEAERALESYTPGQAEYLIRSQWDFEVRGVE